MSRSPLVEPTPPGRRPGQGVHLTEDERHAWHHYCIAFDRYNYDVLMAERGRRDGVLRYQRREAAKRCVWNLKSHLTGMHGRESGRFPADASYEEMTARHDDLHKKAERE